MHKFLGSSTPIIAIILFCVPILCVARIPINVADQVNLTESTVAPRSAHSLNQEISNTSISKSAPTQSNTSLRPWWIGDLITLLGILVGIVIVIYQLGRQHRNELKLQRENYGEQLRLSIYQQFSRIMDAAVHKQIDSYLYASRILIHVQTYCDAVKKGGSHSPLKDRTEELSKLHYDLLKTVVEVIFLIERNQIVDPRLNIFRIAISAAHHDMMETFRPLFLFLLKILPYEISRPDGSNIIVNVINPSDDQINELERLLAAYTAANFDMGCYLHDLSVELQNTLLSNLFPNKVPRRKPLDPKFKVISTEQDEIERLQKYFEEETDWGKTKKRTEQDVLSQLGSH